MANYRRFTKDDWYAYAGATKFRSGEPFIYEHDMNDGEVGIVVITDAAGIQIQIFADGDNDDYDDMVWAIEKKLTAVQAEGEMRAIVKALQDIDHAADLAYNLDHNAGGVFEGFEFIG